MEPFTLHWESFNPPAGILLPTNKDTLPTNKDPFNFFPFTQQQGSFSITTRDHFTFIDDLSATTKDPLTYNLGSFNTQLRIFLPTIEDSSTYHRGSFFLRTIEDLSFYH